MAARCFYADIFSFAGGPGKLPALSLLAAMFLAACAAEPDTIKRIPRTVEDARVIAADQVEAGPREEDGEDSDRPGGEGEAEKNTADALKPVDRPEQSCHRRYPQASGNQHTLKKHRVPDGV